MPTYNFAKRLLLKIIFSNRIFLNRKIKRTLDKYNFLKLKVVNYNVFFLKKMLVFGINK
jgi:hypothetical protein